MERQRIGIIGCGAVGRLPGVPISDDMRQLYDPAAFSRTPEHSENSGRACPHDGQGMAECGIAVETAGAMSGSLFTAERRGAGVAAGKSVGERAGRASAH